MAVACSVPANGEGGSTTDGDTFTTGVIDFVANRLYLLAELSVGNSGAAQTPTSTGTTWVAAVGSSNNLISFDTSGTPTKRLTVWRTMYGADTSSAIQMTFSASRTGCVWIVLEFTGMDTTGTFGSAAVVQAVPTATDASTTGASTLAAFGSADNATVGFGAFDGTGAITVGSGFAARGTQTISTPSARLGGEFLATNDTSVDFTSGGNQDWGVVALEIKAEPVGSASNESNLVSPLSISALQITR